MASNATAFSDLQTMVLEVFKRTDKTTELQRAINETYREMVGCVDPRKQKDRIYKTCVIKQADYTIPDTILRINHPIRLIEPGSTNNSSQNYPLRFYPKDEYDRLEPNPNATDSNGNQNIIPGRPWAYTFWKNAIYLTQIPDKQYTLELNIGGEPSIMVGAADTMIFAPMWDEVLKAGALARLFALITMNEQSTFWQGVYRYGFAGDKDNITGGLGLLKKVEDDLTKAPLICVPKIF